MRTPEPFMLLFRFSSIAYFIKYQHFVYHNFCSLYVFRNVEKQDIPPDTNGNIKDLLTNCEQKVSWWLKDLSKNFEHIPNQERQVSMKILLFSYLYCCGYKLCFISSFHLLIDVSLLHLARTSLSYVYIFDIQYECC